MSEHAVHGFVELLLRLVLHVLIDQADRVEAEVRVAREVAVNLADIEPFRSWRAGARPATRRARIHAADDATRELFLQGTDVAADVAVAPSKSVMLVWACDCDTRVVCSTRCSVGRIPHLRQAGQPGRMTRRSGAT